MGEGFYRVARINKKFNHLVFKNPYVLRIFVKALIDRINKAESDFCLSDVIKKEYDIHPEDRLSSLPYLVLKNIVYMLSFEAKGEGIYQLSLVNRRFNDFIFKDRDIFRLFVRSLLRAQRGLILENVMGSNARDIRFWIRRR